jgi:Neurotransmitter-gated ion-channel ligand binding domain
MRRILVTVFVARSIQLVRSAETPALIERPGSGNGPTQVSIGIWMVDISKIDSAEQTFTAEVALVLRWKDPRLVHTGSRVVRHPLEQVWHPRVAIVNETNSITLPDWTIENWNTKSIGYALAPGFEYSGYAFEFTATRNVQNYILKVIFPLVLIAYSFRSSKSW